MTAVARTSRLGPLLGYTLRACLSRGRWVAVGLACAGAVGFGGLAHALDLPTDRAFANVAAEGIFSLMMPIAALIVGDAVLGAEIRAGTFHFTWLSPTPVWQIVLGRTAGGVLAVLVSIAPATAVAALVAGSPGSAVPALVAAAAGASAYVAVFVAIGAITRRTAVWSLALVFLVERLLGAALSGIAQLSPTWLSRAAFVGLLDDPPDRLVRDGVPSGASALVRLALVGLVSLAVATWRLRRVRLTGPTD